MTFPDRIRSQPQWLTIAEALALTLVIGLADYLTGYEVSLYVFYAAPIIFTVWFCSRRAAIGVCLLCLLVWGLADFGSGHPYSRSGIHFWNLSVHFDFFLFAMICGSALKFRLDQTRERLSELERFYQLAELLPAGVFRAAADGACLYVNARWCEMTGIARGLQLGQKWTLALHPDDRERISAEWRHACAERLPFSFEARFSHPSEHGESWVVGRIAPEDARGLERPGFIGAMAEVSEHRRLEREILEISEREQRRIGQDLHDDLCQFLAAIQFASTAVQRDLERHERPEAKEVRHMGELLREATLRARNLARTIFPVQLEQAGLVSALHELTATAGRAQDVKCTFEVEESIEIDDPTTATHLYRIAQEAMTNAFKHAEPACVAVRLHSEAEHIILEVRDDGRGAAPGALAKAHGMGLQIMKYRSHMIGGSLAITAPPEGGTLVTCSVRRAAAAVPEEALAR